MPLIFEEMPGAFPWYDKIEKQARYKQNCNGICTYKLITPKNALLPFQFRYLKRSLPPVSWNIFGVESNNNYDVTASLQSLNGKTLAGYDYIYYNGEALAGLAMEQGFYYSVISFGGFTYYSEVFFIPENSFNADTQNDYLKIVWHNDTDLPPFYYRDGTTAALLYENVVYLDTFITGPEPAVEEENSKDGNETEIPIFQKVTTRYRITDYLPDYLVKAIVTMQIHDNIILTTPQNIYSGEIVGVSVNVQVDAPGCYSTVDILFEQPLAVINRTCPNPLVEDSCIGEAPIVTQVQNIGDNIAFTAVVPGNSWIDVYGSVTYDGNFVKLASGISAIDITNGTNSTPKQGNLFFKLEAKSFNCSFGISQVVGSEIIPK
jgi:hypothetical protein